MNHQDQSSHAFTAGVRPGALTTNPLWGILVQPARTLTHFRDHPRRSWLAPAILAILLVVAQSLVTVPITNQATAEQVEEQRPTGTVGAQMPPEERAQVEGRMDQRSNLPLVAGTAIVGGLIGLWVRWLLRAGAIHLFSLGLGGRNRFNQVFSMVVWTWVPLLIRSLLQTLTIALGGTVPTHRGLAAYLAALGQPLPTGIQYTLLSQTQLDLFVLWNLLLLALGVLIVTGLSRGKVLVVTAGYWVLATGFSLIPSLVQQFFVSRFLLGPGG